MATTCLLFSNLGCGNGGYRPDEKDSENIIGSPLRTISESTNTDGQEKSTISIFDETVRKIHLFDMDSFTYKKSFLVSNPEKEHFVLTQDQGAYVIDMSEKTVSLHFTTSGATEKLFTFQGVPLSAAYISDRNLFVIYDDLSNVGIAVIDPTGLKHESRIFGPIIDNKSIRSGELLQDGRLVLALTDDSLYIVDPVLSIKNKKWEYTSFTTTLSQITWISQVTNSTNQVFVKSNNKIALIDLNSQTILSEVDVSSFKIEKYSKTYDAHILMRNESTNELKVFFPQNNLVNSRTLLKQDNYILSSHLNIEEDTWTYVDTTSRFTVYYYFNDLNQIKDNRTIKRYRISDLAGLSRKPIRTDAKVQLTQKYSFSLINSELGHALRENIESEENKELKLFNMKHL